MKFSDMDRELFNLAKKVMHGAVSSSKRTNYTMEAELLWVGKHYLLIRSGPWEGKREVEIWSREALLLQQGNPSNNAMMALALATIHPVNKRWTENYRRVLWRQGSYGGDVQFRRKRWGKKLLAEIIAYCEEQDATFQEREERRISVTEKAHKFSQDMCALLQDGGFRINGTIEQDGVKFPVNHVFHVRLEGETGDAANFRFKPDGKRRVRVLWRDVTLSSEEFEVLAGAVIQINNMRKQQAQEEQNDEAA